MYGEDSSGRRVSLLNDDTSTTHPIHHAKTTQARPAIRDRDSQSTSSISSGQSRDGGGGYKSSARSSISCSPLHSPPIPPSLVRLDSKSSVNTPSPMTPQYQFDPMDHHQQQNKFDVSSSVPYYTSQFSQPMHQPHGISGNSNPYPALQDNTSAQYYSMNAPHRLPSVYDMDEPSSRSQQNTLSRLQTSVPHYSNNPMLGSMSPPSTADSSMMPSPASLHQTSVLPNGTPKVYDQTTHLPCSTSTTSYPVPTPIAIDPSNPLAQSISTSSTKATGSSASNVAVPKKKYPCPHAKEHNCSDTFTTSGHAARHGKKHTGEKNVHCPTCDKKFTRKDNMKQHERTHKSGSGSGSGRTATGHRSEHGSSKVNNRTKKRALSSGTMSLTDGDAEHMELDNGDQIGTGISQERPERPSMRGRTELSRILERVVPQDERIDTDAAEEDADADADGEGESPGLDALAHVAAGQMGV